MHTLDEIRAAIRQLPVDQRSELEACLRELDGSPISEGRFKGARPAHPAVDSSSMTLDEFLEFEDKSPLPHEFVDGTPFAMAGASRAHNFITQNLASAIRSHLSRGPCKVFAFEMKLVIRREVNNLSYYPDVIVDSRSDIQDTHCVQNPKLVAEVLSPSTRLIDRREKLQNYRLIDSLEEYVLVAQDERHVTVYSRAEHWKPRVYAGLDTAVELYSIDLTIPLIELYQDVTPP